MTQDAKERQKKLEDFFNNFRQHNAEPEAFRKLAVDHLLEEILFETKDDQKRISKIKILFSKAYQNHEDESSLYLLKFIEKAYELKERNIAEAHKGNKHLGDVVYRAIRQFRDYLMKTYWQLPDMKSIVTGLHSIDDELHPTMLETKFWILKEIANDWRPKRNADSVIEKEASERAFKFLVEAYNGIQSNNSKNKSRTNHQQRFVSVKERKKIIELIKKYDSNFGQKELEELIQDPSLPFNIEKTLAIARTRNDGPESWRRDIQNAEILKSFSPNKRTPTSIKLQKKLGRENATLDDEVKALIVKMQESGLAERHEIGASEYVVGAIEFEIIDLTTVIISVQSESGCSKELSDDVHGRARRHIQKWKYGKEKKIEIELNTYTDEKNSDLRSFVLSYS